MKVDSVLLLGMYESMLRIRQFENKAIELFAAQKVPGFVHLYIGEEAIAVGVCACLGDRDYITSTHRGHGHLIAKGGRLDLMMAELYGRASGYCHGKGGSMHIADANLGILGANGIVGAGMPIAGGAAFACRYRDTDAVAVAFFGDGASNRGTFHESLNLASTFKLPAVFVCENNLYGISNRQSHHMNVTDVSDRAGAYGIPGVTVDGNDVVAVYEAASEAVARARRGDGPTLLEYKTWRQRGHFEGDPGTYKDPAEQKAWIARDPLPRLEKQLQDFGFADAAAIRALHDKVDAEIAAAVRFAEESRLPGAGDLLSDVYAA
ncbi:thiamine pyrophosphate-dependent dehydrogenase E1 component subunit alpha [Siculibacillus lacustris]|uniref:Thiamine pyrophosphate-dependent dehydrogenase E1 component subunit alpha n=1 Tax=Siculibacillus lacustris TaxID=1549641 RepID=A0A4Q9VCE5_9HYPH|nr:thiamine pyrophosphate-dependent dehydrogenase E1 component subunit alpha [Siculibacillus lacustris]TBW32174.1 thiamine pyrophosphate-dependent dehydrogenase E1 component subunit alpha [Siculibacillus lacustris]